MTVEDVRAPGPVAGPTASETLNPATGGENVTLTALALPTFVWQVAVAGSLAPPTWAGATHYAQGSVIMVAGLGYALCTTAGTSGGSAPLKTGVGILDGSVRWTIVTGFGNGLLISGTGGSPTLGPRGGALWPISPSPGGLDLPSCSDPSAIWIAGSGISVLVMGAP